MRIHPTNALAPIRMICVIFIVYGLPFKQRYAETIDYKDYEHKVRKLLDSHIRATGTTQLTELVNISTLRNLIRRLRVSSVMLLKPIPLPTD